MPNARSPTMPTPSSASTTSSKALVSKADGS
jgi:hypothetical protein